MSEITVPDTLFNRIQSGVMGLISTCYIFVLIVAMIIRRKHLPVSSRSPVLLVFQGLSSIGIMSLSLARIAIGRNVFPCPLYAYLWVAVLPFYFTPMFLIALRVWILHVSNRLKARIRALRSTNFPDEDQSAQLLSQEDNKVDRTSIEIEQDYVAQIVAQRRKSSTAERMLWGFRLLGSETVLALINIAVIVFHTLQWAVIVGVSPDLHRLDGCGWSLSMFASFAISFAIYCGLVLIGTLLIIRVRDGFGMWLEYLVCIGLYTLCLIVFVAALLWPGYDLYVEQNFWASLNFVVVFIVGTNTLRLAVPVFVSFVWERRRKANQNKADANDTDKPIELVEQGQASTIAHLQHVPEADVTLIMVLSDRDGLASFQSYCKREFSSENVLCWIDIQKFKKTEDKKKRLAIAHHIEDLYIREGSPLAVNINNEIRIRISNELMASHPQLFEAAEKHLLYVMNDTFSRFTGTRDYSQLVTKKKGKLFKTPTSKS